MSFTNTLHSFFTKSNNREKSKVHSKSVNITAELKNVIVRHKKHNMVIKRASDTNARIPEMYTKTSRPCPPFCIQPEKAAQGVETIGELEVLEYLSKTAIRGSENDTLVVDTRMEEWVSKGTIPGTINIPWTLIAPSQGATTAEITDIFKNKFGVVIKDSVLMEKIDQAVANGSIDALLDFSNAKLLVLFCNGTWCGQTSESIKALIAFGYPPEKIKYFRNGVQGWVDLGLTLISQVDEEPTVCKVG
ncbi:MAG: rhodanese-like domain-containing protein [Thiotrichaceae bacterium]